MKLIVGLGNPGEKYASNRHNIGFAAADEIARGYRFGPWKKRFQGLAAEGQIGTVKCMILKPATYMNESGRAAGEAMRFYKLDASDVIVIHDELDLIAGDVRVKKGGGNAGHNGLKSLSAHIGNDYTRVRLGIGHPGDKSQVAAYVLQDFAKTDSVWIEPLLDGVAKGMSRLVEGSDAAFLSEAARNRSVPVQKAPATRPAATVNGAAASDVSKPEATPANLGPGSVALGRSAEANAASPQTNGTTAASPEIGAEGGQPVFAPDKRSDSGDVSIEALLAASSKPIEAMPLQPLPFAAREGGGGGATSRPVFVTAAGEAEAPADPPSPAMTEKSEPQVELQEPEPLEANFINVALGEAPDAELSSAEPVPASPSFAAAIAEAPALDTEIEWTSDAPTPAAPPPAAPVFPEGEAIDTEPVNPAQSAPLQDAKGVSTRLKSWFQSRVRGAPAQ